MNVPYTVQVPEAVDTALTALATQKETTKEAILEDQLFYYLACSLGDEVDPNNGINTPGLSMKDRAEAWAIYFNEGREAATQFVESRLQ